MDGSYDLWRGLYIMIGGRQVDGAIPSLYALESITKSPKIREAQKTGKLTILFDSGIRTGPDMFKALALGAQAVFRELLPFYPIVHEASRSACCARVSPDTLHHAILLRYFRRSAVDRNCFSLTSLCT